jgi:hypothetical protein
MTANGRVVARMGGGIIVCSGLEHGSGRMTGNHGGPRTIRHPVLTLDQFQAAFI